MAALEEFRYYEGLNAAPDMGMALPFGRCLLALEQNQITLRDLEVLKELAYSQYLTRTQIQSLTLPGVSKSVARRRLEVLTRLGLTAAIRWEDPRPDNTPLHRVAYCLALNGAKLLRHYHAQQLPWRPGMAQRHLRRVLAILAANEFRIQATAQKPDLIQDWRVSTHPMGPVAQFKLSGQLVILDAPRSEEDAAQVNAQRYARWADKAPLILFLTPDEPLASRIFAALKGTFPADRLLFSTDQRAFSTELVSPGFVWQWEESGQALALALT